MKKFKIPVVLAAAVLTLGLGAAGVTYAAVNTSQTNPMSNLVTAIATKFNLNSADVQKVFDEQHTQMQAQKLQSFKDRLATQVTNGKLTQDQANKLIAKMQELMAKHQANMANLQNKTQAERKAIMQEEMQSLKQWAADNNIPAQYLKLGMGKGHMGEGMGRGNKLNK